MRYVEARLEENNREEAYRIYVSKSLQLIPQKKYIGLNYVDMFKGKEHDNPDGEEIVSDIMNRAGLRFGE